jgi:hypothetical protein
MHIGVDLALIEMRERTCRHNADFAVAAYIRYWRTAGCAKRSRKLVSLGQIKAFDFVFTLCKNHIRRARKEVRSVFGTRRAAAARAVAKEKPNKRPFDVVFYRSAQACALMFL